MLTPLTAEDLPPLIAKLSSEERHRLLKLVLRQDRDDAVAAHPVLSGDLAHDGDGEDPLAWESDGWEGLG